MNHVLAIVKKELSSYFNSPIAYIFISVFLVISNWLFFRSFFINGQTRIELFFAYLPWIFLFLIPATTMRLWAEEKQEGTIETLLTWPIKSNEIVAGKFLASLIFVMIALVLSLSLPISLSFIGQLDWGVTIASYLGSILLAAAFLTIGLFISSLTENQIIAFIGAVALSFFLFIIGENFVIYTLPHWLAVFFSAIGLGRHFSSIARGVLDTRDLIYYFSVIALFLYLNIRRINSLRWK